MSHDLPVVTFQSTLHDVILHDLPDVTPGRQVILHDPCFMVQNGREYITYIYYIIKQLLTYVEMECY